MGKGLTGPQMPHRHIATVQAFVGNHKSMPLFDHTFSLKPDYLSLKIQGRNGLVLKQFSYCNEIESVNRGRHYLCYQHRENGWNPYSTMLWSEANDAMKTDSRKIQRIY